MYKEIHTQPPIDGIMLDNAQVTFPAEIYFEEGETKTFSFTLPDELGSDYAICYEAHYLGQEIIVDGVTIYSFATEPMLPFGNMRGSAYIIAPIDPKDAGKLVTIKMTNPFQGFNATLTGIHLTNPGEYKFSLLRNNLWRIRVGMFLGTLSLVMFIRGISLLKLKIDSRNSFAFIYFAFLSLSVATWLLSDAVVMQLYSNKTVVVQYTAVLALLAFSAFYSGLCSCLFFTETATLHIVEMLGYVLFAVMFITYVADLLDPIAFLPVIFIYFFICVIISCALIIKNLSKNAFAKYMLLGTFGLFIGITIGMYMFVNNPTGSDYFKPAIAAYSMYLLILFLILAQYERDVINNSIQMQAYKDIAYKDKLTGLANRAAYELAMDELYNIRKEKHEVRLFIGDLNNLKKVNDTLGHDAGDKLIRGAAEFIDKILYGK